MVRNGARNRVRGAVRATGVLAALCLAGTVAGCGGGTGGEPVAAPSASDGATAAGATTGEKATVPAKDLVLTGTELPAGYATLPVDQSMMSKMMKEITGAGSKATFTPAACGSPSMFAEAAKIDLSSMGVVAAQKDGTSLAETVIADTPDLAKLKKNITGQCSDVSIEMDTMGQHVTSRAQYREIPAPKTDADQIVTLAQTTTSEVAGQQVTQKALVAYARVGGYGVTVQSMGIGGEPDQSAFDTTVVAAMAKVAARK